MKDCVKNKVKFERMKKIYVKLLGLQHEARKDTQSQYKQT